MPAFADGVWASRDGTRALLLAQTRASGSDTDGQQRALATIAPGFDEASASRAGRPACCFPVPGPSRSRRARPSVTM